MRNSFFALLIIAGLAVLVVTPASSTPGPRSLKIRIDSGPLWVEDFDTENPAIGYRHFVSRDSNAVDLNVSPSEPELLSELERLGEPNFVHQLMDGKNLAAHIFGIESSEMVEQFFVKDANFVRVTLRTHQNLPDGTYTVLDKYFLNHDNTWHVALRWRDGATDSARENAEKDFANLHPTNVEPQ
jgi:hypothetical protein